MQRSFTVNKDVMQHAENHHMQRNTTACNGVSLNVLCNDVSLYTTMFHCM